MATVYRRQDTGSPTLTFNTGSAHAAHFNALKLILKACLVEGYGSKPAAGWSLVAEGDLHLLLLNATHSGYLCLTRPSTSANYAEVWMSRTYGGVVNDRLTGAGLKSGLASSNGTPHKISTFCLVYSSALTTWYCVADSKSFVLVMAGVDSATTALQGGNTNSMYGQQLHYCRLTLYAGEDSAGNFIACGGQNTTATSSITNYFSEAGFTSLVDPATGLLVDVGSLTAELPSMHTNTYLDERTALLAAADLSPVPWVSGVFNGRLRGLCTVASLMKKSPNAAAKSLGVGSDFNAANYSTPFDLGDGYAYFLAAYSFHGSRVMVTDNPEFW